MWDSIEKAISKATGKSFKADSAVPVAGGCINEAVCLQGEHRSFFIKLNSAARMDMFDAEAAGLAAIRDSRAIRAPEPICCGANSKQCWLALEFIPFGRQQPGTSAQLGEQLAAMHRHTAPTFGWERDNTIGSTPQHNERATDWVAFVQQHRIGFQLELAGRNGAPHSLLDRGQRLLQELPGFFKGYRPLPSLLHGDLWGGNWDSTVDGTPVIFDPAVYFGDREADMAMTELFGGFDKNFYAAYAGAWLLDQGYSTRKQLYNLYHILNHLNLFGGGYAQQAQDMVEQLLADLGT